jgi:hypothetical protein
MNLTPLILGLIAALPLASGLEQAPSKIIFTNKDELSGSLKSIEFDRLVLSSPLLDRSTPLFLNVVREVHLNAEPSQIDSRHQATVFLTNGDQIQGQLLNVSPAIVELQTTFGARLKLNRLMISQVKISESRKLLYRGPNGLDSWQQNAESPNWTYTNGQLHSSRAGSIARTIEFPAECRIAFEASSDGPFALKLNLFSSDITTDRPTSGYELSFRQQTVSARNAKTLKVLGYTRNAGALQENEKAHIEIRYSEKTRKLALFVDQELIEIWTDSAPEQKPDGKGLHFAAVQDTTVHISKIEISNWDPEIDPLPDPENSAVNPPMPLNDDMENPSAADKPAPKSDRFELRNGDSLVGEVLNIQDEQITLKTPFRDVTLPIEALRNILLQPVSLERCKRENGDVRVSTTDGSVLVFRLLTLNDGQLTGRSQNFGDATFDLSTLQRIDFNIYPRSRDELTERAH